MNNDNSEIINQVAKKNHIEISSFEKFSSGQVNNVFNINNELVLKIEGDHPKAKGILDGQAKQINQLLNRGAKTSKLLDFGNIENKSYLLMEKVEGQNLVYDWLGFTAQQKENFIAQIAEQLQIFHSIKSDKYFDKYDNFKDAITAETDSKEIDKSKLKPEYLEDLEILEDFFANNIQVLDETNTAVLNHNDLHFENIFYQGDKITGIIDFDWTRFAAKDYELRKLIDFAHSPTDYVEDSLYEKYKDQQLISEIKWLKKYYPAMFDSQELLIRAKLYLRDGLLWMTQEYLAGNWSENVMIKNHKKVHDWYQTDWLEKLLS